MPMNSITQALGYYYFNLSNQELFKFDVINIYIVYL